MHTAFIMLYDVIIKSTWACASRDSLRSIEPNTVPVMMTVGTIKSIVQVICGEIRKSDAPQPIIYKSETKTTGTRVSLQDNGSIDKNETCMYCKYLKYSFLPAQYSVIPVKCRA